MFQQVSDSNFVPGEHDVLNFWTRSDTFRKLREKFYAKGYATAARPIKEGSPIYVNFSGGGSRSVAQ